EAAIPVVALPGVADGQVDVLRLGVDADDAVALRAQPQRQLARAAARVEDLQPAHPLQVVEDDVVFRVGVLVGGALLQVGILVLVKRAHPLSFPRLPAYPAGIREPSPYQNSPLRARARRGAGLPCPAEGHPPGS